MVNRLRSSNFFINIWIFSLTSIIMMLTIVNCASPPLNVNITLLAPCQGSDQNGLPQGITNELSIKQGKLFICGHLHANKTPIYLSVNWYRNNQRIFRETLRVEEYFYSTFDPNGEDLKMGNYQVEVIVGKTTMQTVEFEVK